MPALYTGTGYPIFLFLFGFIEKLVYLIGNNIFHYVVDNHKYTPLGHKAFKTFYGNAGKNPPVSNERLGQTDADYSILYLKNRQADISLFLLFFYEFFPIRQALFFLKKVPIY